MQNFILLTRLISEEVHPSFSIQNKEKSVTRHIRKFLPEIKWISSFATLGPWDYIDIFEAPNEEAALKLSSLVRFYGGAHTEIWPCMKWKKFESALRDLTETVEK